MLIAIIQLPADTTALMARKTLRPWGPSMPLDPRGVQLASTYACSVRPLYWASIDFIH